MTFLPKSYLELFSERNFLLLMLVTLIGQIASAFLILALIVSVFSKTGSNFGVSGVIISFSSPGLLMVFAGLFADLFDRKKIIVAANVYICAIVFLIIVTMGDIFASLTLSFLYFAGNAFFVPAATAASAQLVKKNQLLASNSIFVFCLAGGQLLGFMLGAFVHFFFGGLVTILVCLALLVVAAILSVLLPSMPSRERKNITLIASVVRIFRAFIFIFGRKKTCFFFVVLAFMQGIIAFGVTLAPGFFDEVLNIPIQRSLVFVFPMVGLGALIGAIYVHNPKIKEGRFLTIGVGSMGVPGLVLGILMLAKVIPANVLPVLVCIYLVLLGFGVIVSMIASRTVLQRFVSHNYLGTVFGANTILASVFTAVLSPFAAGSEALFGYVRLLILAGFAFSLASGLLIVGAKKWKF